MKDLVIAIEETAKAERLASYFNRAQARILLGEPRLAIDDIDAAIALAPNNANLLYMRGGAHQSNGNPSAALRDYEAALALSPDNATFRAARDTLAKR